MKFSKSGEFCPKGTTGAQITLYTRPARICRLLIRTFSKLLLPFRSQALLRFPILKKQRVTSLESKISIPFYFTSIAVVDRASAAGNDHELHFRALKSSDTS